ncbi:histone-lysine N-methyltransferase PRDM9-like isoform X2 [Neoarius graeffei]|uniref:histone-lysine N-methyltransferase PRDM9-like isoform X2 n=1 Tax=Neoarius graeffei TaxID=443677 RepID=UPI00298C20F2|nr:histone-lysine N-methyltransferase PRDM9-like isoform X2 [Neoarius graeffei]
MAQFTFQEQLLSVMEVLAKAATEEINRRVADSCAVIRLELSRSQRDIDSLKRKCQVMENELRKVRGRGRRKVFVCSSSEKIPFQSVCARDTDVNVCRAEQPVPPSQEDPAASTPHIHQTVQILEDRSAATAIKEEGNENDPWNRREGQFPYGCHGNKPYNPAQEISEEQNRFSEDMERQRTHLTHISSPVTSNEERPSSLRLKVKTEKEEEDEKEVAEVILVEGPEQSREETNHLEFAYNSNSNEAERTDKSFMPTQLSCDLSVFSQPAEAAMEQSGNDAKTIQNDQIEMYGVGQVSVHEHPQPAWCRDRAHEADHMVQRQRHDGSSAHQQHRSLSRSSEAGVGVRTRDGMASQAGSNIPHQVFLGRGRGGLRRFRAQRVTSMGGERRFRCSFCERTFMRFGQLKEHMRSHTGERPYACSQCGRSFTKQGNLIRHAVVHSGEKPYQCNLCGKCFTQRSSLKSHQKTHTPDRGTVLQGLAVRQLVREQHDSLAVTQTRGFV